MTFGKTLLATAAIVALTTTAFAQVTPGGPGERKASQSPSMTATQAPAGTQPGTQGDVANKGAKTTGSAVHESNAPSSPQSKVKGSGGAGGPIKADDSGDRKSNEAPGMSK